MSEQVERALIILAESVDNLTKEIKDLKDGTYIAEPYYAGDGAHDVYGHNIIFYPKQVNDPS